MKYENKVFINGRMDRDSDPAYVKNGEYTYALNVRPYNTINGSVGVITNVTGSTEINFDFGINPSINLYCVGSKLDLVRNRVYWFVTADSDNSYILYYDYRLKNVEVVYNYTKLLGFDKDVKINDIDIVYDDELGDTLLWVGAGEPRKINVLAAYNRFNKFKLSGQFLIGDYTFANYVPNDTASLNRYQDAPLNMVFVATAPNTTPPVYNFETGEYTHDDVWQLTGVNSCYPPELFKTMFYQKPITPWFSPNARYRYTPEQESSSALNIKEKSYEFCYKYVYFDGQESEWSPKSEATLPIGLTSFIFDEDGQGVDLEYENPVSVDIRIPINLVRASDLDTFVDVPHSMIAKVLIAVREVPDSYSPNDWYQLASIPFDELFNYGISTDLVSKNFPPSNTDGSFYYNWDSLSYLQDPSNLSRVTTITYPYDGSQTLIPIDIIDAVTVFYPVPKEARTQAMGVNRVIWGSVLQGTTIPKTVYDSFAQNISLSINSNIQAFNIVETNNVINEFGANIGGIIPPDNKSASVAFEFSPAYGEINYLSTFSYDFSITVTMNIFTIGSGVTPRFYNLSASGTVHGGLITAGYTNMEDFLQQVLAIAFSKYSLTNTLTVSFDEVTSVLGIIIRDDVLVDPSNVVSDSVSKEGGFYRNIGINPVRTLKNHSQQQIGFSFQDDAGRVTPVVTGEWAKLDVGHFINNSGVVNQDYIAINGFENVSLPQGTRVLHVLKKRSGSFSRFFQFTLSLKNCVSSSWNYDRAFYVGLLDLSLDEFTASSFGGGTENVYITLNSMSGSAGGSYNSLRERIKNQAEIESLKNRIFDYEYELFRNPDRAEDKRRRKTGYNDRLRGTINKMKARLSLLEEGTDSTPIPSIFTPTEKSAVRFLYRLDSNGDIVETYSALFSISSYSEKWNTVVLNFDEVNKKEPALATYLRFNSGTNPDGIIAEIIDQPTESENELYWESAAQLSCTNGSVDIGATNDTLFLLGDTYLKLRGYAIDGGISGSFNPQNFTVIDRNFNDFYASANNGEGRPSAVITGVQRGADYQSESRRGNLMIYSEKSIQSTDVRKFGTVFDLNIQEVDNNFGVIEKISSEGDKIDIFQEDKTSYAFLERSMTTELSGEQRVITSSSPVISDIVYSTFNGGISLDGDSFAKTGYRSYFTDTKRGAVYRKSMDGITNISDSGMSGEFKKLFTSIRQSLMPTTLRGVIHDVYDEYILSANYSQRFEVQVFNVVGGFATFTLPELAPDGAYVVYYNQSNFYAAYPVQPAYDPKLYAISGRTGNNIVFNADIPELQNGDTIEVEFMTSQTFVYSERTKGWSTYLSHTSEWMSDGVQGYHTFVNGQMWFHDINNTDYNTFHGRQFPSKIETVDNRDPQLTKTWRTTAIKSDFPLFSIEENDIETSTGNNSRIPRNSFVLREGHYKSPYYRDSNEDILRGSRLKGTWLRQRVTANVPDVNTTKMNIFGMLFNSNDSPFTQ